GLGCFLPSIPAIAPEQQRARFSSLTLQHQLALLPTVPLSMRFASSRRTGFQACLGGGILPVESKNRQAEKPICQNSQDGYLPTAARYTSIAAAMSSTAMPSDLKIVVSSTRAGTIPASASPSSA